MKKILTIPNILTSMRIIGAFLLILVPPFSIEFYGIYTVSGISDALDGWTARATNSTSTFGSKLDSVADLLFFSVMLILIFPVLRQYIPIWLWYSIGGILFVRLCSYLMVAFKYHCFASLHTYLNKLTGIVLFFVPYFVHSTPYCVVVCVIAAVATIEEFLLHFLGKTYQLGCKSILCYQKVKKDEKIVDR